MGGLWSRMPATTTAFVVGSAGMVTLLPLGSFWAMLSWADGFVDVNPWVIGVLVLVNGLTALNLTRVFRLVFWGEPQQKTRRAPEVGWQMALPMVISDSADSTITSDATAMVFATRLGKY